MVEPTHDRESDYFAPCILRGRNRADRFRNLLLNPLMRSCLVEVHYIVIEHALKLLLVEDQQMSRHSCHTLLKKRSQIALARGA